MYSYQGLTTYEEDKPIYYIGDSKYYKMTTALGKPSVSKQQSAPSHDIPPQQQSQRPTIDDNTPRPVSFPTARESFFTPSSYNQPVLPIATPTGKQTPAITKPVAKFEVEVDLKATPGAITIRFYQKMRCSINPWMRTGAVCMTLLLLASRQ